MPNEFIYTDVPSEVLWLILMVVSFGGILTVYFLFGKTGLYVWTVLAVIVANIQVLKLVEIFGFATALGNVVYGTTFLATDILAEKYGTKDARRAVLLGFFAFVTFTLLVQLCLSFAPHPEDFLSDDLVRVFGLLPRILVASLSAYFVSQLLDVWLFSRLKRAMGGRRLWLRNNLSTMASQFVDNVIFTAIAFTGVFPFETILSIFLVSYVMKWIVAACDTPLVYLAKRITPLGDPARDA